MALKRYSAELGLQINRSKTVTMAWNDTNLRGPTLESVETQMVDRFKYLGSTVTTDGDSEQEIWVRMAMARAVVVQLANVWKGKEIGKSLKVKFMKALVWTVAMYGSETWTMKKKQDKSV